MTEKLEPDEKTIASLNASLEKCWNDAENPLPYIKTAMFLDYSELLNALDSGAFAKITINNRRIDKAEFEKDLLLPETGDGLDHFRKEYNEMLLSKVTGVSSSVVQDRYITVSVVKKKMCIRDRPRLMEAEADLERVLVIDDRDTPLTLADERIARAIHTMAGWNRLRNRYHG